MLHAKRWAAARRLKLVMDVSLPAESNRYCLNEVQSPETADYSRYQPATVSVIIRQL